MSMRAPFQTILVVDSDSDFLAWMRKQLETDSTQIVTMERADAAYEYYKKARPDLLITDTQIQPFGGLELLTRVRQNDVSALVILVSFSSTTRIAIESMKLGAFEYLPKERLSFTLKSVVDAALVEQQQMRSATASNLQLSIEQVRESLVGQSATMQQVFKAIGRVADTDTSVMITGESGTGKELVARAIHHHSRRNKGNFVAVNCAAIPESLLESELFGHEKGAFTGAISQRIGRFEQCHGGTLFLDEIGDMPFSLQSKILRVLQEGEFSRLGNSALQRTDARIIAATNKNLEQEVANKIFREDLFYRLHVVRITLPPLRKRVEDIRLLAEYFLRKVADRRNLPVMRLSEEAVKVMEDYAWPGNVRELENVMQRATAMATADVLLPKDLLLSGHNVSGFMKEDKAPHGWDKSTLIEALLRLAQADPGQPLLPWLEREFTLHAMSMTHGNQVQAAKLLGITRATLRKRLQQFQSTHL